MAIQMARGRHASRCDGSGSNPVARRAPSFANRLLSWYDEHKRDLPWRNDRDPYRVWIAEIMLQQTRVAAVLDHYQRFLQRFPTLEKLAAARQASVLSAWSGLGYYRRASMLHAAARRVVKEHRGRIPESSKGLLGLPGIGRYTAAAIASIAYDEPAAVVDGNVERVLSRVAGRRLAGAETWQAADALLDAARPGDFNQAMMELGATVCLPRQPRCLLCPVAPLCETRGELKATRTTPRQQKRQVVLGLARRNGAVFLVQRERGLTLMPGMWELPECSAEAKVKLLLTLRHTITVTDYLVSVVEMVNFDQGRGKWVAVSQLRSLPLTGLARKILRRVEML